jgi:cardiolipin synthase
MERSALVRSLPNLITIGRLVLVPAVVSMIAGHLWTAAFLCFLVAGVSDAIDGWLARTFDLRSELGAYLDPLADKALLISIFVSLAAVGVLPVSLAFLVVFRDIMIIGAIVVSWGLDRPVQIRPLLVSKANTAAQISFAGLALAIQAFGLDLGAWWGVCMGLVAALTLASGAAYLTQWLAHMSAPEPGPGF